MCVCDFRILLKINKCWVCFCGFGVGGRVVSGDCFKWRLWPGIEESKAHLGSSLTRGVDLLCFGV